MAEPCSRGADRDEPISLGDDGQRTRVENLPDRTPLDAIAVVVRSAVMAHARVAKLASASALNDISLGHLPWGAAIIDHGLAAHEMNEAYAGALKHADGLSLLGGRLVCRRSEDHQAAMLPVGAPKKHQMRLGDIDAADVTVQTTLYIPPLTAPSPRVGRAASAAPP